MKELTLEKRCKGLYVDCGQLQKCWVFLLSNIKMSQREACDLDKFMELIEMKFLHIPRPYKTSLICFSSPPRNMKFNISFVLDVMSFLSHHYNYG
jgi:hypothetical protein